MLRLISKLYYKLIGWKLVDHFPKEIKKCVIIGAPHTSYLDFPIGLAGLKMQGLKIRYLAKRELFKFPFKFIFSKTGGIPVDRSKKSNLVDQMVQLFDDSNELLFAVAPESTRKMVDRWKTGFYHIALGAKVPIILGYLDYKNKLAGYGHVILPSGDMEKDMQLIKEFYSSKAAKHPSQFNVDAIGV